MDPDEHAFRQAICTTPADDTPRLVYADWLQEHNDEPLAHWIRKRVASPDVVTILGPSDSVSAFGGVVGRGLRAFAGKGVYPEGKLSYRRGFVASVECTAEMWLAVESEIYWHPAQTAKCPVKYGRNTRYRNTRYPRPNNLHAGCKMCKGTGLVTRPLPPTAQPIECVTLTTTFPYTVHDDGTATIVGRTARHRVPRGETPDHSQRGISKTLAEIEWPGVVFELPPLMHEAEEPLDLTAFHAITGDIINQLYRDAAQSTGVPAHLIGNVTGVPGCPTTVWQPLAGESIDATAGDEEACPVCPGTTRNPDDDGNPCAWCQAPGTVPVGTPAPGH